MNKLLLEVNFRLRNTEEYNKIKDKFIENGFDTIAVENINNREFEIELLINYINENKLREKYEKIVVISNIEDAIFVWHRIYNFLADDFIFFIDKYNYSLLKGKIYEELSNMNAIEKENLDEIYINLTSENIERIGIKISKIKNCKY